MVGRGGGDRTHDLRLKTPGLYRRMKRVAAGIVRGLKGIEARLRKRVEN
jgi:hypothetical protein